MWNGKTRKILTQLLANSVLLVCGLVKKKSRMSLVALRHIETRVFAYGVCAEQTIADRCRHRSICGTTHSTQTPATVLEVRHFAGAFALMLADMFVDPRCSRDQILDRVEIEHH